MCTRQTGKKKKGKKKASGKKQKQIQIKSPTSLNL